VVRRYLRGFRSQPRHGYREAAPSLGRLGEEAAFYRDPCMAQLASGPASSN
jgi:hypothetical protein